VEETRSVDDEEDGDGDEDEEAAADDNDAVPLRDDRVGTEDFSFLFSFKTVLLNSSFFSLAESATPFLPRFLTTFSSVFPSLFSTSSTFLFLPFAFDEGADSVLLTTSFIVPLRGLFET
tara:strand:- start:554 stop:910 length:357 start_codon:yes stop_codon:yes gene_type:complete